MKTSLSILGGDWPIDARIAADQQLASSSFTQVFKGLEITTGAWWPKLERIEAAQIASAEIVNSENHTSVLAKLGWASVGALAFGPAGLLAGALGTGNRSNLTVALKLLDGRKLLLQGKASVMNKIVGAAFTKSC